MILVENITIGYSTPLISSDALKIKASEFVGIVGLNGSGKSTLLKTIAGIIPPLNGQVFIDSDNIKLLNRKALAKKVAFSFTQYNIFGNATFKDVVSLGRTPHTGIFDIPSNKDKEEVNNAMALLGITHFTKKLFREASDGEKQKCMLARCIAQETPVILLDEPTAFLDHPSKIEVYNQLKNFSSEKEKTIVLVSHDLHMIEQNCDTIWLVHEGGILTNNDTHFRTIWEQFKKGIRKS